MVGKRVIYVILIVTILTSPVIATGMVYISSDPGDIPLYRALSDKLDISLSEKRGDDIILALDLNYEFMNKSARKTLITLLRDAKRGKTVIIGLNTLRSLKIEIPQTLNILRISVNFTKDGILVIKPKGRFKFRSFGYDSDVYGTVIVRAPRERILLNSSRIPVLVEIPIGKGKLVIITINPSAYYLDSKNPGIVEFLISVVKYYSDRRFPVKTAAVLVFLGVGTIYIAVSSSQSADKIRKSLKLVPIIIGRFMVSPEDVLKNSTRKAIYSYIRVRGYTTINDVASTFSISRTNARWHLSVLKRAKLIDETTVGNTVIFHIPGKENQKKAIRDFLLENKIRREIYNLLSTGKSLSEIAKILRISKSTVHYNIRILKEYGIVGEKDEQK
ncbi:helix-turn-helix domain-containing protein [Thermococcus sp.]